MIRLTLYLLALQDGKFYVGQSDRPEVRFADHQLGIGAKWTRLHQPIALAKTRLIEVVDLREAILYENWMTLHYMEKYGWQNVRGGDYLDLEDYRITEKIAHIYDTDTNQIRYFILDCLYLFGATHYWLIYVLELEHGFYYVGSGKRLGKALGDHFGGKTIGWTREHPPLRVAELQIARPEDGHYLALKDRIKQDYIKKFGQDKVLGGNAR
jgi:predicted GIY-YIG superfamily endonuclease